MFRAMSFTPFSVRPHAPERFPRTRVESVYSVRVRYEFLPRTPREDEHT